MNLIEGDGPFTIFAPVNSAFEKWLEENNLSAEEALALPTVPDILKRHVLATKLLAKDALAAVADGPIELDTLGVKVMAEKKGEDLSIGGAKVIATDVMASNGVVHVVDAVAEGVTSNAQRYSYSTTLMDYYEKEETRDKCNASFTYSTIRK